MPPQDETPVSVKFWGVRGSIATDGEEVMATGGNTACVEIRCGPHLLLFDAGTGLRKAGRNFVGFCPFHPNSRTPAFTVFPDSQSYHCFGCKAGAGSS